MANEFRKSFDDMARQAELDELRQEIEALKKSNPLADVEAALNEPVAASAPPTPEPRSGELKVTDTAP
jgi:sec-independent protein translocase protein TatB